MKRTPHPASNAWGESFIPNKCVCRSRSLRKTPIDANVSLLEINQLEGKVGKVTGWYRCSEFRLKLFVVGWIHVRVILRSVLGFLQAKEKGQNERAHMHSLLTASKYTMEKLIKNRLSILQVEYLRSEVLEIGRSRDVRNVWCRKTSFLR